MTLEEAIEILKDNAESIQESKKEVEGFKVDSVYKALIDLENALDTAINYIENESIPKEKVKDLMKNLKLRGGKDGGKHEEYIVYDLALDILEELLGG